VIRRFDLTGIRPKFDPRFKVKGLDLPATMFMKRGA
jgi:hypothetical protein